VDRQYFTIGSGKSRVTLKEGKLHDVYGLKDGDTVVFKDLGLQVGYRTVFYVEYFGPLLMHALPFFFPEIVYGQEAQRSYLQKVAFWCVIGHYVKRELESALVHRFSNATMPVFNIFKNSFHYWVLGGIAVSYFLYHPKYTNSASPATVMTCVAMFILCELGNLHSHLTLAALRPPGTRARGNPRGGMFELVSCANYTYEIFAWVAFCIFTQTLTAYLFLFVSTGQIAIWALKKHKALKREFGKTNWPRGRKILFPFLW